MPALTVCRITISFHVSIHSRPIRQPAPQPTERGVRNFDEKAAAPGAAAVNATVRRRPYSFLISAYHAAACSMSALA